MPRRKPSAPRVDTIFPLCCGADSLFQHRGIEHSTALGGGVLGSYMKIWLILGFGVVAPRSGDQGTDERGEKLFAPFACIVNELEEPEIDRQLLLGNAPMGS